MCGLSMCLCFDQKICFEKFINLRVHKNYWVCEMEFLRGERKLKAQKLKGANIKGVRYHEKFKK